MKKCSGYTPLESFSIYPVRDQRSYGVYNRDDIDKISILYRKDRVKAAPFLTGFTLLELLLAVALVAIIMSILYGVIYSTIEGQTRIEQILEGSEIGPQIINLIKHDLEAAFMPSDDKPYFQGGDRKAYYGGEADRLDFITTIPSLTEDQKTFAMVNEVSYVAKPDPQKVGIVTLYRREDNFIDDEPATGGLLYEVYDKVKSINFEYFDGEKWQVEWNSKDKKQMPQAVKIELIIFLSDKQTDERKFQTIVTF